MSEIAKMLQAYGGWGVAATCMFVIWKMWQYIVKRNEYIDQLHVEQREDNRDTVTALITTRDAIRSFKDMLQLLAASRDIDSKKSDKV